MIHRDMTAHGFTPNPFRCQISVVTVNEKEFNMLRHNFSKLTMMFLLVYGYCSESDGSKLVLTSVLLLMNFIYKCKLHLCQSHPYIKMASDVTDITHINPLKTKRICFM
jgi:hypothetical protein